MINNLRKKKSIVLRINALAIICLLIVGGSVLAFQPEKTAIAQDDVLWGRTMGTPGWVQIDETTECIQGDQECKRYYPLGQNPNDNPSGGTPHPDGDLGFIP